MLLNSLLTKHKEILRPNEGMPLADIKPALMFSSLVRTSAESVLELVMGTSLICPTKCTLSLNPYYPIFVGSKCVMSKIVSDSYDDLVINQVMVNKMCSVATGGPTAALTCA